MDFDKETMRSLMIDHIDGKITGELAKYVDLHIEKNPDARAEYQELKEVLTLMSLEKELEVPGEGKEIFLEMAEEEIHKSSVSSSKLRKLNFSFVLKIAAVISFVVAGYIGGTWINNKSRTELQALQVELKKTKELVLMSMMKQESASERLKGILTSSEFDQVDEDIIDALIMAMNQDSNVNVRIAAAEALAKFSADEKAKSALIASLNNQNYPAVQMKLIDILVSLGDKNALVPMREFTEKEDIIKSVKDEAHMGIFKLM
jgi:hypothetical protein